MGNSQMGRSAMNKLQMNASRGFQFTDDDEGNVIVGDSTEGGATGRKKLSNRTTSMVTSRIGSRY